VPYLSALEVSRRYTNLPLPYHTWHACNIVQVRRMDSGLHLMTVLPRRLACREYVSRQMIREVAERFENDEFRQHDDERNDPHDDDHAASST